MTSFSTLTTLGLFGVLATLAQAQRPLPDSLRQFRDSLYSKQCPNVLQGGLKGGSYAGDNVYCGDHLQDMGIIYTQGSAQGMLTDMDVDCDGAPVSDGRCENDPTGQPVTAFADEVRSYNKGIDDLAADKIPYVVFGNNNPGFKPEDFGMKPLSVMAVVCGDNVVYGVWGDSNGHGTTGEASLSLATLCYGYGMNGNAGHTEMDVLYIGFTGDEAKPFADGASWAASNPWEFEASIASIGDRLVSKIGGYQRKREALSPKEFRRAPMVTEVA